MDDLVEKIKASIENRNSDPWFPELTADLAAHAWDNLHRDIGLTPESYGTERVVSHSISARREIITSLKTCSPTGATARAIAIEALTEKFASEYQKQGVSFYASAEIPDTAVLSCLEDAFAIINQVPSLMRTVVVLVRSLHVIKPEDADYDLSFSEPHIPFSIFVSVPEMRIVNDALRVAEAIVHEAMHLQLTLIESTSPLLLSRSKRYYSPWRKEYRDAEGILHALYVFRVIKRFFEYLSSTEGQPLNVAVYIRNRCDEINRQFEAVRSLRLESDLSRVGACFTQRLV